MADSRVTISIVGQERWPEARQAARQVFREGKAEERLNFASQTLDDGETLFLLGDARLSPLYCLIWEEFRDGIMESGRTSEAKDLLGSFASRMLNDGFLEPAREAHSYLLSPDSKLTLVKTDRIILLINLGATLRDMDEFDQARKVFSEAFDLSNGFDEALAASARAGIADCDLFWFRDLARAKEGYQKSFDDGRRLKDLSAEFWGRMGLGDVMFEEHNYDPAIVMYREGLHYISTSAVSRLYLGLGRTYLALGKLDDADLYLNRGAAACRRHSYAYRLNRFQKAFTQLQNAKALA